MSGERSGDKGVRPAAEAQAAGKAASPSKARAAPAESPSRQDLLGSVINGSYKLLRKLGQGGMGTVYAARDLNLERDVAVKVIREEMREKATIVARFRREAQCIAQLKHPNVLDCYAFGVDEALGVLYMVTPLLVGRSLHEAMEEDGRLPAAAAIKLVEQICAGLQAAHDRGIVHRDLKPANVFLEKSLEGERVKLIDFGLAMPTRENEGTQITRADGVLGTPTYMSPEQVSGKEVTALSDLYSLGLVLYQLLTGTVAFDGDSVADVLAKQLRDPPPLEPLRQSGVSPALEKVVLKATAKKPQDRYESAKTLLDALRSAAGGGKAEAAPRPGAIQNAPTLMDEAERAPAPPPAKASRPSPLQAAQTAVDEAETEPAGSDDDLVFTDEVGGKPGAPLAAPAPDAPRPAPVSPPAAGSATANRQRGLGTTSSSRMKALGPPALEPARGLKRGSSSPDAAALEPARAAKGRAGFEPGGAPAGAATSERTRRRVDEPASVTAPIKAGGTLGEFSVVARVPDGPLASSGRFADDEPLKVWKAERKGREARVLELVVSPTAAQDVAVRADRLLSVRLEELETILASGRSRDGAFLVFDARESLRQSVKAGGPLSEREAMAAIRAAARAITGLRQRGLCHGDPSPRHLLLEPEGAVRLASPARVRPARLAFTTGTITGDPRYAAPEVLDGQEPTGASDIYTLGLSLLFLVTGNEPVAADDAFAAFQKRIELPARTPDVAASAPMLTAGARALYARMAALDPLLRPEPSELVTEIDSFLASGTIHPLPPAKRVTGSLPRALVPLPVAALVLIAGLALAGYAVFSLLKPAGEDAGETFHFEATTDGK